MFSRENPRKLKYFEEFLIKNTILQLFEGDGRHLAGGGAMWRYATERVSLRKVIDLLPLWFLKWNARKFVCLNN